MDSCPLIKAEAGFLPSESGLADRLPGQPASPGELPSLPWTAAQNGKCSAVYLRIGFMQPEAARGRKTLSMWLLLTQHGGGKPRALESG